MLNNIKPHGIRMKGVHPKLWVNDWINAPNPAREYFEPSFAQKTENITNEEITKIKKVQPAQ